MRKIIIAAASLSFALAGCATVDRADATLARLSSGSLPAACATVAVAQGYFAVLGPQISAANHARYDAASRVVARVCAERPADTASALATLAGAWADIQAATVVRVVSRADEMGELVSLYWKRPGNKKMLPAQLKLGLAAAMERFDEYQLAKYNRDADVRIRDVLFLIHAKPKGVLRKGLYERLAENKLATPDTWEVNLSAGADKKTTFERMLRENSLGYMALIRNLRNMVDAGVDRELVDNAIRLRAASGAKRVLPFRFIAAARHAPSFEPALDAAMMATVAEMPQFEGTTYVMVDVSQSMDAQLSGKSEMRRADAACALAAIIPAKNTRVFSFSNSLVEVPPRRGMAGVDAIMRSQIHAGTALGSAVALVNEMMNRDDRLIVITDEQASLEKRRIPDPTCDKAYMINVASYQNGVGYGKWTHIDGWSDGVFRFIHEAESHPELNVTSDT